jgi:hypothetical protein
MKEQRITIEIDREGRIIADADGFTGDACITDLERLLESLAPGTASLNRKPDASNANMTSARRQDVGKKS